MSWYVLFKWYVEEEIFIYIKYIDTNLTLSSFIFYYYIDWYEIKIK